MKIMFSSVFFNSEISYRDIIDFNKKNFLQFTDLNRIARLLRLALLNELNTSQAIFTEKYTEWNDCVCVSGRHEFNIWLTCV